jgi:hypothetical protein
MSKTERGVVAYCQRIPFVATLCVFCTSLSLAEAPSVDRLNAKSLEAGVSFAQTLAQWSFALVGGSLLVLIGTSHRFPSSRAKRAPYLLFLAGWFCLAMSIYFATRAQRVYVAYLLLPVTTIEGATQKLNADIGNQIQWLLYGLGVFGLWLIYYLFWWVFSNEKVEGKRA